MVPSTMSPSLKYLVVSSMAARKSSSEPMSLTATCGASERVGVIVMWKRNLRVDRCRAGTRRNPFHHHDCVSLPITVSHGGPTASERLLRLRLRQTSGAPRSLSAAVVGVQPAVPPADPAALSL